MATDRREVVLFGPAKPTIVKGLETACTVYKAVDASDREAFIAEHGNVRAIACAQGQMSANLLERFPKLEIIASFGVGYDNVDVKYAAAHGIIVTNTPEVLTEEVADTALGLLLCTVRELSPGRALCARRKLGDRRAYPLSKATLRNRTVGIVGMGAIGQAIARRLEAFGVPVVYHTRTAAA